MSPFTTPGSSRRFCSSGEQDVAVHHAWEQSPFLLVASEPCDRQGAQDQCRDCGHGGDRAPHFFQQHAGGEEAHVTAAELLG
jgi:predicted ABC-type transport system involved in lysophospholipase L1 biosynthesis ATPase subunit